MALKRLLAGTFASAATRRRFEREVEAAAVLSHPGIVEVRGLEPVEGLPVLVMEWVDGEPITEWARGRGREELLATFLAVCDAVHHAHRHGVLHRDLKPANVLVDRGGHPRVLDFGLAKVTDESVLDVSSSAEVVGTPAYAAPEQLTQGVERLDVRADVYSLGAILFEMLTGRRLVLGDGVQALAQAMEGRAAPRPSRLAQGIGGELDAILWTATAPERERRYVDVVAFAQDLRRLLAGEAVLAHPPSLGYRLRKLVRRQPVATLLALVLLGASLVFLAVGVRQAGRVAQERDRAVLAAEAEGRARAEAQRAYDRAAREASRAEAALDFLLRDVIEAADPRVVGPEATLADVLEVVSSRVDRRFSHTPKVEAEVRAMLAGAFGALGRYDEAIRQGRMVLEGRRADPTADEEGLVAAELALARALMGGNRYAEAEGLFLATLERPSGETGWRVAALDDLAGLYSRTGRFAQAADALRRALVLEQDAADVDPEQHRITRHNLAATLHLAGELEEARELYEEILLEQAEHQGERSEGFAAILVNLADLHLLTGDCPLALEQLELALDVRRERLGDDHPAVVELVGILGHALAVCGEGARSLELLREATAMARASGAGDHDLGRQLYRLAVTLGALGQGREAEELLVESRRRLARVLEPDHPDRAAVESALESLAIPGE